VFTKSQFRVGMDVLAQGANFIQKRKIKQFHAPNCATHAPHTQGASCGQQCL
jgi:hypothetical protein